MRNLGRTDSRSQLARSSSGYNLETRGGTTQGYENKSHSSTLVCTYCKKPGHSIAQCKHPNCRIANKPSTSTKPLQLSKSNKPVFTCNSNSPSHLFKPFLQPGQVSLGDASTHFDITILRDTAAAQTVLIQDALPDIKTVFTGGKALLTDLSQEQPYPLASVYLKCPWLEGKVEVAVKEKPLPVPGVHMLLGNDLAGELVVPTLRVSDKPLPADTTINPLYPACAVTRSQSRLKTPVANRALETSLESLNSRSITKEELVKAQQ